MPTIKVPLQIHWNCPTGYGCSVAQPSIIFALDTHTKSELLKSLHMPLAQGVPRMKIGVFIVRHLRMGMDADVIHMLDQGRFVE
ncbi:hypothetical protein P691DRAFT_802009 [Macrolepiota fuliginosa MF-IS2]|uniref:Uncharacterized protein n=1 Tax=Macrolepiota fuliginosa MF-IS2 TaxID=1400762 RepID=A0A9P5XKK1_9AGAR|nr:hypothetical protein P691DRAFT_802009 [Macrolepiota fuliginosa MF-IS2]